MVAIQRKQFSVEDYYSMLEVGVLTEEDRVELIKGEIIEMSPIGSKHGGYVKMLSNIIKETLRQQVITSVQDPVRLGRFSEPEPDIAVLKPRADFYTESHPTPKDVFFLIEVADTSIGYDFDVKLPLYAAAGIPEVWILDVQAEQITQHTAPTAHAYSKMDTFRKGMVLKCSILDFELDLSGVFLE